MVLDDDIAPDISILLAQTWRSIQGEFIEMDAICRIWSFDLSWFDMETSLRVRDNLIEAAWLDAPPNGLRSNVDIRNVEVPFGWMPTMRQLNDPPLLAKGKQYSANISTENKVQTDVAPIEEVAAIDPAASHIVDILDKIAADSGIERKEVMRRAQRKRRSLGPVTLWMALLLVAREQKLPMHEFVQTLSTS